MWQYLKRKQINGYDFHRQKPIDEYIVDFFCNKLRLVIEVDGITHGFKSVLVKDKIQDTRLKYLGLSVIRFQDKDIMNNIEGVIERINDFIREFEKTHTP